MVNLIDMLESTSTTIAGRTESAAPQSEEVKTMIDVRDLTFAYGNHEVLHEVSLQIPPRAVTAFSGDDGHLLVRVSPDWRKSLMRSRWVGPGSAS